MLRRHSSIASAALGLRSIMQLTQSNHVLQNNAKHRNFKMDVWVEQEDDYWWKELTQPRAGEATTSVLRPTRIELYNLDQLVKKPEVPAQVAGHFSLKTKERYSPTFSGQLDKFAKEHRFDSKWWVSSAEIRKLKLQINRGEIPFVTIFNKAGNFFNAEQFTRPEIIQMRAYNGATARAYSAEVSEVLQQHAVANGFSSAVYFTERQLRTLGLLLTPGAVGAAMPMIAQDSQGMMIFPLHAVEKYETFLSSLQRFTVDVPTYVISGKPLDADVLSKVKDIANPTNYWVSRREVESRGFVIKEGERGINLMSEGLYTTQVFNLHQLTNVQEAFTKIGRYVPTHEAA